MAEQFFLLSKREDFVNLKNHWFCWTFDYIHDLALTWKCFEQMDKCVFNQKALGQNRTLYQRQPCSREVSWLRLVRICYNLFMKFRAHSQTLLPRTNWPLSSDSISHVICCYTRFDTQTIAKQMVTIYRKDHVGYWCQIHLNNIFNLWKSFHVEIISTS